jgi:hypothetical protein
MVKYTRRILGRLQKRSVEKRKVDAGAVRVPVTRGDTEFTAAMNKEYQRTFRDGTYVYWLTHEKDGYWAICPGTTGRKYDLIHPLKDVNNVPRTLEWMKRLCDDGITIEGRETGENISDEEYYGIGKGVNKRIAEIIDTVQHKTFGKIALVRWVGENMGTASFVPVKDLMNCDQAIHELEAQKKRGIRLGDMKIWKHVPAGSEAPLAVRPIKMCNQRRVRNIKGRGRKKSLFGGYKNPKQEKARFYKAWREGNSCLFDVINGVYHALPRIAIAQLAAISQKSMPELEGKLSAIFERYHTGLNLESIEERSVHGKLCANLPQKEGVVFVMYRMIGAAHCGVLYDGVPVDLPMYKRLDSEEFILTEQKGFKSAMQKKTFSITNFVIS